MKKIDEILGKNIQTRNIAENDLYSEDEIKDAISREMKSIAKFRDMLSKKNED